MSTITGQVDLTPIEAAVLAAYRRGLGHGHRLRPWQLAREANVNPSSIYRVVYQLAALGLLPPDYRATFTGMPTPASPSDDLEAGLPDPPSPAEIQAACESIRSTWDACRWLRAWSKLGPTASVSPDYLTHEITEDATAARAYMSRDRIHTSRDRTHTADDRHRHH